MNANTKPAWVRKIKIYYNDHNKIEENLNLGGNIKERDINI